MNRREEEFLARLRATFKGEATDHLATITAGLLELEKNPAPAARKECVAKIFRAAHSLKGAARAVNFTDIESICQSLEDVFATWNRGASTPSSATLDSLHRKLDAIHAAMAPSTPSPVPPPKPPAENRDATPAPPPVAGALAVAPVAEAAPVAETVRIPISALDAQLLEAEELLSAKLTAGQRAAELRELSAWFDTWSQEWARVQLSARALRQSADRTGIASGAPDLVRLLDFSDWSFDRVKALENRLAALARTARHDHHAVGKLVDDLLENAKKLLMLPFATLTAVLPRLVRDLCREQGKDAQLVVRGDEIAIDKRVLEEMKDPLIHLIRNCVDHGIEPAGRRTTVGKPAGATITVAVAPINGDKVELLVADDGGGVDVERVKAAAIDRGLITIEEAHMLDEKTALGLIFRAEVSTSPIITHVSGRGLGLAIVRENTDKLGGTVTVESRRGVGTTFRIVLPLTLATARGVTITSAGRSFIVPSLHVERVARVRREDVQTVEGRETISFGGRAIALARLADTLELPRNAEEDAEPSAVLPVIVLGVGEQRVAFGVDAVLDEQEVLVKRLAKPLSRVRNIAGATVVGSGQVVPILNVADLLKSARRLGRPFLRPVAATTGGTAAKSILVAEDSITSRMLLKGILESAGYVVKTAVDGVDALTLLRMQTFDLVVSDVEMPRLNGFDLTRTIRADKKLAELPVVLVTALETREDRERGIDVGANAYIVKSSFDQSNLLEAVGRLV
jgi:two-component system, chemotaxis family, sensor kinase CheA